jgi:hypothetical protein
MYYCNYLPYSGEAILINENTYSMRLQNNMNAIIHYINEHEIEIKTKFFDKILYKINIYTTSDLMINSKTDIQFSKVTNCYDDKGSLYRIECFSQGYDNYGICNYTIKQNRVIKKYVFENKKKMLYIKNYKKNDIIKKFNF